MKLNKGKYATYYIHEKELNIINQQKRKSEYINEAIILYSILEKQLPKVIIEILLKHPGEITLSYFLNNESNLHNDNSLADIEKIAPSVYNSELETSINKSIDDVVESKQDEEVINNLQAYL